MRLTVFSAQSYDRDSLEAVARERLAGRDVTLVHQPVALSLSTAILAEGSQAVCVFVNDRLDAAVLEALQALGVRAVLLRCAGYNNLDLAAARRLGLFVARVPAYSPEAVAEHALALLMTLNRKTHRAYNRVREGNFALDGLLGSTLNGKTVGLVGLGQIGLATARIFYGLGCRVLGHDPQPPAAFAAYGDAVALDALLNEADVISLHCPLLESTRYLIDAVALARMKPGAVLINTSRGALIDTEAVIQALKRRQLGGLAIDVYEQESELFFQDRSHDYIDDDLFVRLMTFPNVLITGHQGFFTAEALREIALVTLGNLADFLDGRACPNAL